MTHEKSRRPANPSSNGGIFGGHSSRPEFHQLPSIYRKREKLFQPAPRRDFLFWPERVLWIASCTPAQMPELAQDPTSDFDCTLREFRRTYQAVLTTKLCYYRLSGKCLAYLCAVKGDARRAGRRACVRGPAVRVGSGCCCCSGAGVCVGPGRPAGYAR